MGNHQTVLNMPAEPACACPGDNLRHANLGTTTSTISFWCVASGDCARQKLSTGPLQMHVSLSFLYTWDINPSSNTPKHEHHVSRDLRSCRLRSNSTMSLRGADARVPSTLYLPSVLRHRPDVSRSQTLATRLRERPVLLRGAQRFGSQDDGQAAPPRHRATRTRREGSI